MRPAFFVVTLLSLAPYAIARDFHYMSRQYTQGQWNPDQCTTSPDGALDCCQYDLQLLPLEAGAFTQEDIGCDNFLGQDNKRFIVKSENTAVYPGILCGQSGLEFKDPDGTGNWKLVDNVEKVFAECSFQGPEFFCSKTQPCERAAVTDILLCSDKTDGNVCP